jgi:xanthine dehydrogenase accessory factor
MSADLFSTIVGVLSRGERAAMLTIVRASGSTPQRVGARMLVHEDGSTLGTIGGGCYENDACQKARRVLVDGRPQLVRYDLNDDVAEESGLTCGGQMEVFIEPIAAPPDLYVFGAGHIGQQVGRLAASVGFRVHVVDDREKFANRERFPDAAEVVAEPIPEWLRATALPPGAYGIIVTRGHRHDLDVLRELAGRHLRYLGLIGSRAKVARLFDLLVTDGVAPDRLTRVHAPIGLDIGAVTPEEIAVSIVAELIAAKYGKLSTGADGRPDVVARPMKWTPATVRT